jgi:membrane-bound metal-dependent hydrolase YbcI (DUF457 family)
MLGRSHMLHGASLWMTIAATAAWAHHPISSGGVVYGTAVCAGAALVPDLDTPQSTVARTFGPVTRAAAWVVGRFGASVHAWTRTRLDRRDLDGHRTVCHTLLAAVLVGWAAWTGTVLAGRWGPPVLIASMAGLAWQAVATRRGGYAVAALAVWQWPPATLTWVGWATFCGCLSHCLADGCTESGVPLLWPLKLGGRRWALLGLPRSMRLTTGSRADHLAAGGAVLNCAAAAAYLLWR